MPELPEVENMKLTIQRYMQHTVTQVYHSRYKLRNSHLYPIPTNNHLKDTVLTNITRHGKYLFVNTSNQINLLIHAGMSGNIITSYQPYCAQKHDHVILYINHDNAIIFNDPRRFGCFGIINTKQHYDITTTLGIDALSPQLTPQYLHSLLHNKSQDIKQLLMKQTLIAGIGNIYASEILFASKIHPLTKGYQISNYNQLSTVIKEILTQAILAGGSSIKNYKQSNLTAGNFQTQHQVYNRNNQPCNVCGHLISKIIQQQRSTYLCSNCQLQPKY